MSVRFGAQIMAAATDHHLDPRLLAAVAAQETGGPGANSGRNIIGDRGHGHGVFQIDDRSWAFARSPRAMDPLANAEMAATILADNLHAYGGDLREALSAYNAGSPHAVGTRTTWRDGKTLGYADSVLRHYAALAGEFGTHGPPAPARAVVAASEPKRTPTPPAHPPETFAATLLGRTPDVREPAVAPGGLGPVGTGSLGVAGGEAGGLALAGLGLDSRATSAQPAGQFSGVASWSQLTRASDDATRAADRTTAELVDADAVDVFDDGSSDDA